MIGGEQWSLQRATVDDAPAIATFHTGCWTDAYRGIVPDAVLDNLDVSDRTDRWRRRLAVGYRTTVVAALAVPRGRIVGLATWGPSHDPSEPELPPLELASLYVARDQWGTGLAGVLLEHAVGRAPAHLWVYEANHRGRAFYQKHGFVPDGRAKVDEATGVLECRYVRR